ncbi:hypothetical protein WH87_03350 [Devosia epidermidihirudinis]|uniref:Uncharacterized protein n=1 Tax=Devosia epidermidihirudinis TaxID=1293439 RepID=A0A0F5QE89_9HYPH|nr:hypothetical protein [Devosia epidermidihirudinis]KKC39275.1 hypothetical protein WH87_03350 [Devosia epidermidihirudinis]
MMSLSHKSLRHRTLTLLLGTAIASLTALTVAQPALAGVGFSILVDGEHVAGDPVPGDAVRRTDVDLARAEIQVTYDGLVSTPRLAVGPTHGLRRVELGASIPFRIEANYWRWIERAEIRILDQSMNQVLAVVPVEGDRASWALPNLDNATYYYVARVYDRNGRFDETVPQEIYAGTETGKSVGLQALWEQDQTASRAISVHGGSVTVHGKAMRPGSTAYVLGEAVEVDANGAFVIQRILPSGDHAVDVTVEGADGKSVAFNRDINIPDSEWFYVGMADLTLGTRWGDGKVVDAKPEEFDAIYSKGRAAFYLRGKIRGDVLLTAAGDTGEGPLSEMFSGVLSKDPQALLRRIDPSQYYPVYGDDSVMVDDAPTSGKLYVRLERGNNHVLWGNFRTEIGNGTMLRSQRSLYGASLHVETDGAVANGAPQAEATLYAAQPRTLPAQDTLRGTGGSAYVLRRQDLVPGSEIISVETRNGVTGLVTDTRRLRAGVDYTINYMQGLVILAQPLSGTIHSSGAVSSSEPDIVDLVVQYEFQPAGTDTREYAYGGSASSWIGENLRVGVVGMSETNSKADEVTVVGVNARLQADEKTFIEGEVLRSEGQGQGGWLSTDGGFTYVQQPRVNAAGGAYAYRATAQADLGSLLDASFDLVAGVTLEQRQAGFSTLESQVLTDTLSATAYASLGLGEAGRFDLKANHTENATGALRTEVSAELGYVLDEDWTVSVGVLHRNTFRPGGTDENNGNRTDVGARVSYSALEDVTLYGFGQATINHSAGYQRNDRVGAGLEWSIGDGWSIGVEGSAGTTGPQANAMLSHADSAGNRSYLGLRMSPDIADSFLLRSTPANGVVTGTERRISDVAKVNAENIYDVFGAKHSLTGLYGITVTPDSRWTVTATYETGSITDPNASDFSRHAVSGGLAYSHEGIEWSGRGEGRFEESSDHTRDRTTLLGQSGLSVKVDDNWRMLGGASMLLSQSNQNTILDGDYVEVSLGAAYRPVDNDRFNALIRYNYLYDLPGPDQVSVGGTTLGPAQRSHIFSVDANYDLTPQLTVGVKYGLRVGEVSDSRAVDDFAASTVHLGILRADLEVFEDWRLLLEGRGLLHAQTEVLDLGALAMISYDISDTVRLGLGYNFGQFSDDLRRVRYDDHGLFLNFAARF